MSIACNPSPLHSGVCEEKNYRLHLSISVSEDSFISIHQMSGKKGRDLGKVL